MTDSDAFTDTPLGRQVDVVNQYTPSLLCPIARARMRAHLDLDAHVLPFEGADLLTAWELTWLDRDGKPEVGVLQIRVPCSSRAVIESKSLKLYLVSFSQTVFATPYDVVRTVESDLSVTAGAPVVVELLSMAQALQGGVGTFTGDCLDALRVPLNRYEPDAGLLELVHDGHPARETVYSNLFRSVCPVTGQPDLASIQIQYEGTRIRNESLLRYLVSFREHRGFHEQCVERIFRDIQAICRPRELTVYARFLRRGGIDINPWRSTGRSIPPHLRVARQ